MPGHHRVEARATSHFALALLATAVGLLSPAHAEPFHTGTLSGPSAEIGDTINYQVTVTGNGTHPTLIATRGAGVQWTGGWSGSGWSCFAPDSDTTVCYYNLPNILGNGVQAPLLSLSYAVNGTYQPECWAYSVPHQSGEVSTGSPDYKKLFTPGPCAALAVADAFYANPGPGFTGNFQTMDVEGTPLVDPNDQKSFWRSLAGGVWDDPANWTNGVPYMQSGAGVSAVFSIPATYTVASVAMLDHPNARRVQIEAGDVTLDLSQPVQFPDPNFPFCLPNCFPMLFPRRLIVEESLDVSAGANLHTCSPALIEAPVVNNQGIITPGCSAGQLHVIGDYVQGPTGTLEIELGNPYDILIVDGTATLDGVLELTALGPIAGLTFHFLQAGSVGGDFSDVQNLTGVELAVDVETGEITSVAGVPAIGLPGLMLLSAALLGTARTRRRGRA